MEQGLLSVDGLLMRAQQLAEQAESRADGAIQLAAVSRAWAHIAAVRARQQDQSATVSYLRSRSARGIF